MDWSSFELREIASWPDGSRFVRLLGSDLEDRLSRAGIRARCIRKPRHEAWLLGSDGHPVWMAEIRSQTEGLADLQTEPYWWSDALREAGEFGNWQIEDAVRARPKILGILRTLAPVLHSSSLSRALGNAMCPLLPIDGAEPAMRSAHADLAVRLAHLQTKEWRTEKAAKSMFSVGFASLLTWFPLATRWPLFLESYRDDPSREPHSLLDSILGPWFRVTRVSEGWRVRSAVIDGTVREIVHPTSISEALEKIGVLISGEAQARVWLEQQTDWPVLAPDVETALILGVPSESIAVQDLE